MEMMDIKPKQLLAQIKNGSAPLILDVRSAPEFNAGHVPGAVHLPFWSALFRAGSLQVKRDDPIVVYCGHGPRAEMAASALRIRGLRNVRFLQGHMAEWLRAGLPTER
jgi:hydroxyacylglutathione hydrolase